MKEPLKILLILLACFVLAGVFFFSLYSGLSSSPPPISRASFFELTIANNIGERGTDDPLLASLGGDVETGLQDILSSIRKAKIDDKIKGILLKPKFVGAGWGKTEEIRNALLDFKESGKPLYAYIEAVSNKEYYLASTADSIFGLGTGLMLVSGFLSEPMFLKDTFKKIGIEADFVAHGKYKSAPEVYTRASMSDPQREVINNLLDHFYDNLVNKIADARSIPAEQIAKHVDEGFYTLDRASGYQLIDSLMYYHQVKDMIKEKHGDNLRFVGLNRYKQVPFSSLGVSGDRKFAVIYGVGTIVMGGAGLNGQNDLITSEGMAADIKKAAENDDIEAIILRIDSPGGSGTASDIIWREVVEARKAKPVIVSISDLCASGGYYISMAADTIVAHPNSIVGSIGVFAGNFPGMAYTMKLTPTSPASSAGAMPTSSQHRRLLPMSKRPLCAASSWIFMMTLSARLPKAAV